MSVALEGRERVKTIESRTKRWLTIETSPTDENLEQCNQQNESILYQIPKELRDLIFGYACTQSEDPRHQYKQTAFYYRPGYKARHKCYTGLLITCRRAWLEANALPMQQAEHCFWFQRGPYDPHAESGYMANLRNERDRYARFLRPLTTSNLRNLTHIHLFLQMFQLEEYSRQDRLGMFFSDHYVTQGLRPKIFHITIRQSDWHDWERNEHMKLGDNIVQSFLDAPRLGCVKEFWLELETSEDRKDQLNSMVERLQQLEGKPTLLDPTDSKCQTESAFNIKQPPDVMEWSRSPRLDDKDWPVFKDVPELKLYAVTLKWAGKYSHTEGQSSELLALTTTQYPPAYAPITPMALTPSMIMRHRQRRALLTVAHWNQLRSFPWYADAMWSELCVQAKKMEDVRRERFERMFADIEAENVTNEWRVQKSLLRFGGILP